MSQTSLINDGDKTFLIRIVEQGDSYGRNMCLTHDEERALIEFYDHDFDFEYDRDQKLGQFVSRYYIETLQSSEYTPSFTQHSTHGLNLQGDVPKWSISAKAMNHVMRFVDQLESPKERIA